MYDGLLKGQSSSVPLFCIGISFKTLLLSTHPRQFYFKCGIEDVPCIWKVLVDIVDYEFCVDVFGQSFCSDTVV